MSYLFIVGVILGLLCLSLDKALSADCNNGAKFGKENPDSKAVFGNTNTYYLVPNGDYVFGCCGVIEYWKYETEATGDVQLLVWRNTGGNNYKIASTYTHTAASVGEHQVTLGASYLVLSTDVVGWFSAIDIVGHKTGGDQATGLYLPQASVNVAGVTDWGPGTPQNVEWAIGGTLSPPQAPTAPNPLTESKVNTSPVDDEVIAVEFNDPDISDELTLTLSPSTYFRIEDFGNSTGMIKVNSNLLPLTNGNEVLYVTATDLCGKTVTATVTVSVTNIKPVLTNYPTTADVSEDARTDKTIVTFNCNDSSGVYNASLTVNPADNPPFFFARESATVPNEFGVVVPAQNNPSHEFNYNNQPHYDVTVDCCDNVECVSKTMRVYLLQNSPPIIHNLPATVNVSITAGISTPIFWVNITDPEDDTINATAICDPNANLPICFFKILDTGYVIVSDPIDPDVAGIDLFIHIRDSKKVGIYRTLSINLIGRNNPPFILNLDNSVRVNDGTAANTELFTVLATDDNGDTLYYQWTQASNGTAYFDINLMNGTVTTSTTIDFDAIVPKVLPFVVVVSDTVDSVTATLTISIVTANKPFWFTSNVHRVDVVERTAVGTILSDLVFTFIDGDASDTYICTMDCTPYTGYYLMEPFCIVYVAASYKLDEGLPNSITCTVTAEDSGGNVNTTTLIISIDDENNYTPILSSSFYDFGVYYLAAANTDVGYVSATDQDIGSNGIITFSLTPNNASEDYFTIDGSTGLLQTRVSMVTCDCPGSSYLMTVYATDFGGFVSSSTVRVTVNESIPTTTAETEVLKDRYKTFFGDKRNIIWFIVLIIVLVITVIVTVFVCIKYVCTKAYKVSALKRRAKGTRFKRAAPERSKNTEIYNIRTPPPVIGK